VYVENQKGPSPLIFMRGFNMGNKKNTNPSNTVVENAEVPVVETKTARVRTHKLSDNPAENVTGENSIATYRLRLALDAIETFGKCCGKRFAWTPEQRTAASVALDHAVNAAMNNLNNGPEATENTIVL
jgi:TPP-dependent pyruvate/acetoin dehydrogenase alpha subunit